MLTSAGGVTVMGIALKLLGIKDVKVGNFLPALVIAPALVGLWGWFPVRPGQEVRTTADDRGHFAGATAVPAAPPVVGQTLEPGGWRATKPAVERIALVQRVPPPEARSCRSGARRRP